MLASGGEDQEGFSLGRDRFVRAIQKDRSDFFGQRGAAGFSGFQDDVPFAPEIVAEQPGLGRFTAPFDALERHQQASRGSPLLSHHYRSKTLE